MKFYLRIYALLFAQFVKTRMTYRADFVISVFGMLMRQLGALFGLWVLFQTITDIDGWTAYQLLFIYGYIQLVIVPQQTCLENLWMFNGHLRQGTFIKYYMKPMNPLFYFLSDAFDIKGFAQLIVGVVAVTVAANNLDLHWSFGSVLFLLLSFVCSFLILGSLMLISGTTGFWTMSSTSLMMFTERLKSYAHFPTTIYGTNLRVVFSYLIPLGFVGFFPCQAFLTNEGYLSVLLPMVTLAVVFSVFAVWFWNVGIKRYEGTGS